MGKKARFDRGYSMGFGRKGRTISVTRSPSQDLRRKISVARSPSQNRYIGIFLPGMKPTSVPEVGKATRGPGRVLRVVQNLPEGRVGY